MTEQTTDDHTNMNGNKPKAVVLLVASLLIIASLGIYFYRQSPYFVGSNAYWAAAAESLKKSLPAPVDEMTTLVAVEYTDRTMTYFNKVKMPDPRLSLAEEIVRMKKDLNEQLASRVCSTSQFQKLLDSNLKVIYDYSLADGTQLLKMTLDREACRNVQPMK